MDVTKVVYNFLDNLEDGRVISGWELFSIINGITGRHTYPSTLIGYCRKYCDIVGGDWECINRQESRYKYHKGVFQIGNITIFGKE